MVRRSRSRRMERLRNVIDTFRQNGATTPDTAMTLEALGLPPRVEVLLQRHVGRLGLFLEVNGKNYLSETRLKQLEAQRAARQTTHETRKTRLTLRIVRALISILVVTLLLVNVFVHRLELRLVPSGLLIASVGVSLLQLYHLTRLRNRYPILSE